MGLENELGKLEKSDPEVAEAARNYDEAIDRLLYGSRIERYRAHLEGNCPDNCPYKHREVSGR